MHIIGLCGKAGSGKDTVADILVRDCGFVKIAFADPLKRICKDVFEFTDEQLWGPSEKRNELDLRYCRTPHQKGFDPVDGRPTSIEAEYLTPRYALQQLGTEWGRDCYPDIWIEYAMRVAQKLRMSGVLRSLHYSYNAIDGLIASNTPLGDKPKGVVISDVRFENEVRGLVTRGAKVFKINRPTQGLKGSAGAHRSETEMDTIPAELFSGVIENTGTLEDLIVTVQGLASNLSIQARDEDFAKMLTGIDMAEGPDKTALVTVKKTEDKPVIEDVVEFKLTPAKHVTPDGQTVLDPETPQQENLRGMLEARERDVEAGRIQSYDPSQVDVPPFKRKR